MALSDILLLTGGLALFLYGMKMMSVGLENAAGDKLQLILEKLTANRMIGVLVGAGITAIIQSSSATTVMVVGFVNAGMMKLSQAVWIIMGANIGTTITGQLIALDIGVIAPLFAIVGVVMATFFNNKRVSCLGEIIAGLGILFIGMGMMSDAMIPLRDNAQFIQLMSSVSNPFVAIAVGAIFTAIIQSSSASIGILQALASSGVIGLQSSAFILFGQNIGTCITAFLASLGANRNAKRTTIIHLLFNVIGTVIFVALCLASPLISFVQSWTPDLPMAQIANLHTLFNVTTTLLLLPFGAKLAEFTTVLLPIKEDEKEDSLKPQYIDDMQLGSTVLAISQLKKEIVHMFSIVEKSMKIVFDGYHRSADLNMHKISKNEDKINFLNMEITKFMGKVAALEMLPNDSLKVNAYFKIASDLERVGDHILNLSQSVEAMIKKEVRFDEEVIAEISNLYAILQQEIAQLHSASFYLSDEGLKDVENNEQKIDDLTFFYRQQQINRLKNQKCDAKSAVTYSELLTDIERISDHILNVAQECRNSKISLEVND